MSTLTSNQRHILDEIRGLLTKHNADSLTLYLRLHEIETSTTKKGGVPPWRNEPSGTFVDFLRTHLNNSIDTTRYTTVVSALNHWGEDFLRKVGIEAIKTLMLKAILKNGERKAKLRLLIEEDMKRNKVAPTPDRIKELALTVAVELVRTGRKSRATGLDARIRELEAENAKLTEQLTEAHAEIERLKAKVKRLKSENHTSRRKAA